MEKIESINLHWMRNNEHFQFMTDFEKLITKHLPEDPLISSLNSEFKVLLTDEATAMRVEQGSSKTQLLENFDTQRDNTWSAILTKITANLKSPIENEVAYAQELIRIFDLYGDIRELSYNEESAALTNLVNDLDKTEHETAITTLGISAWVTELKNQNEQFQALFNDRNKELAGRNNGNVKSIRKLLDPLYEKIVERINASIVMELTGRTTSSFVDELNEKISYYKTTLAIRTANKKNTETAE